VLHSFSGVRPLFDDGKGNPSAVTRDYSFDLDEGDGAPMLSIYGGKITTFRELSEHAIEKVAKFFPSIGPSWTRDGILPGGDIPNADFVQFAEDMRSAYPWMPRKLIHYFGRLYGTLTRTIIGGATSLDGLGRHFGANLYESEVRYLVAREWAMTAEDVLRRRTKQALHMSAAEQAAFTDWFDATFPTAA
jgi:glycerol-3-phosphate dehydrogenase